MPRRRLPARLYLRRSRDDRGSVFVILDGSREIGTGAGRDERAKAEAALQAYLARNHRPPRGASGPSELLVSEVLSAYLAEYAPTRPSAAWIADMATDVLAWWGDKALSEVNGRNCRAYLDWRTAQPIAKFTKSKPRLVSVATARHELSVLRAAIRYWHREHGPLQSVPMVTLPPKTPPREDYFLTRGDIARRIRVARRRPDTQHVARLLLLGLYSGTRPGAMLKLRWLPSTDGGWIDLDNEIVHRRALQAVRSKTKLQPPARIHQRLLPHLQRWHREDTARGITSVIHYEGRPVKKVRRAWRTVRIEAGGKGNDSPHILRHSSATMFMSWGVDVALIAGYLGMSIDVLLDVYGHHHPQFQAAIAQATPRKRANRKRTG